MTLTRSNALLDKAKETQKLLYDSKRAAKTHRELQSGDEVRIAPYPGSSKWTPGVVVQPHSAPRSYIVESGGRRFRRNSQHLRASTAAANQSRHVIVDEPWPETSMAEQKPTPATPEHHPSSLEAAPNSPRVQPGVPYTTRRGRPIKPPDRLNI